ncbi:MAG: acyl carrier protein [Paenibacillaceae bacterium]|jgi:acyl carrier protein|nr:acyl carrier protein [Paenibacillaceae bacterium]
MDMPEIRSKLMKFLRKNYKIDHPITDDMSFVDDLGLDSVNMTELIFLLEDLLGRQIQDSELVHLTTVGSALDFLAAEKGAVS